MPAWYANNAIQPLDPTAVDTLTDTEIAFYKQHTGISDISELRAHILAIQARAFAIFPYPCIRRLAFTKLKISRFEAYKEVLQLGRDRPGAILLDLGCCFGNDARKAVADGFPGTQVIATDLKQEFWELGHELFRSTPESCPIRFIQGDFLDPSLVAMNLTSPPTSGDVLSACTAQRSLAPLQHLVSAIYASAFFHLFSEEDQLHIAKACQTLLSHQPGSIIFGSQRGSDVAASRGTDRGDSFAHSPESWKEMWKKAAPDGSLHVDAWLSDEETSVSDTLAVEEHAVDERGVQLFKGRWLVWVVRRI